MMILYPSVNTFLVPESKGKEIHEGSTIQNSISFSSWYQTRMDVQVP